MDEEKMSDVNSTPLLGLFDASRAIQSGKLSAAEYLSQCAARADALEPALHAFVSRNPLATLIAELPAADGPLSGIPIGVKDLVATKDLPTTNGSAIYVDQMLSHDAPIVTRIRSLGGAIFGKTVTTEFAWRGPGPTVNPCNPLHTPGGSSSGSAAAVGAGILPLALGTQTVGSVIRPAAYCGIVGFKASFGAVPREDVFPFASSLDHVGFLTRSVDDAAFAFNLLRNKSCDEQDSIVLPAVAMDAQTGVAPSAAPRLAMLKTPFDDRLTEEQKQAMAQAIATLRASGAIVEEFSLPDIYWSGIDAMFCLLESEGGAVHEEHVKLFPERVTQHITDLVKNGKLRGAMEYLHARALQKKLRKEFAAAIAKYDAVLTVPATGAAPEGLSSTGDPIFCALWSFLGVPALTLPITKNAQGLSLGLQLVAPYQQDATLLRIGKWTEARL
jgi:Asp-tRNA(Asn)/Glu-tRNA(Gln) amidotransferase A subunit family amidase